MSSTNLDRRKFLEKGLIVASTAGLAASVLTSCSKKAETPPPTPKAATPSTPETPVDPASFTYVGKDHQGANSLMYVDVAANAKPELKKERAGTPFDKQNCLNCQFYKNVKGSAGGTCQLIPGKDLVKAAGWCNNWVMKKA